ncbi:MAG: SAM-dependent methyltransferase, partial [Pyrinomonadaceae bacterium]
ELNEFYVGLSEDESFAWLLKKPSKEGLARYVAGYDGELVEEQIVEVNLDMLDWIESVSQKIRSGYLVTVDYGAEAGELFGAIERRGGTLRAFHRHMLNDDVLARPGEQDLTTTVDWTLMKGAGAANGFEVVEFERLDKFLLKVGLLEQVEFIVNQTNLESEKLWLRSQAREMVLPGGMAESFQVLVQRRN